jgi:hypothetical protein
MSSQVSEEQLAMLTFLSDYGIVSVKGLKSQLGTKKPRKTTRLPSSQCCMARAGFGITSRQCTRKATIGDFCNAHNTPPRNQKICDDPYCRAGREGRAHKFGWEHRGRWDEKPPAWFPPTAWSGGETSDRGEEIKKTKNPILDDSEDEETEEEQEPVQQETKQEEPEQETKQEESEQETKQEEPEQETQDDLEEERRKLDEDEGYDEDGFDDEDFDDEDE